MQRFIGLGQGNCEKGVVDREKGVGGDGREASVRSGQINRSSCGNEMKEHMR